MHTQNLEKWVKKYDFKETGSTVAIIMAGNFPLAGFHDFICGVISGNKIIAKPSSDDKILICFFIDYLNELALDKLHLPSLRSKNVHGVKEVSKCHFLSPYGT